MGYGFDSIEGIVETALRVEAATQGLSADEALKERRSVLTEVDERKRIARTSRQQLGERAGDRGGQGSRPRGTCCPCEHRSTTVSRRGPPRSAMKCHGTTRGRNEREQHELCGHRGSSGWRSWARNWRAQHGEQGLHGGRVQPLDGKDEGAHRRPREGREVHRGRGSSSVRRQSLPSEEDHDHGESGKAGGRDHRPAPSAPGKGGPPHRRG